VRADVQYSAANFVNVLGGSQTPAGGFAALDDDEGIRVVRVSPGWVERGDRRSLVKSPS
jgi:hypothetical protein